MGMTLTAVPTICRQCGHDEHDHSGPDRECRWESGPMACRCRGLRTNVDYRKQVQT